MRAYKPWLAYSCYVYMFVLCTGALIVCRGSFTGCWCCAAPVFSLYASLWACQASPWQGSRAHFAVCALAVAPTAMWILCQSLLTSCSITASPQQSSATDVTRRGDDCTDLRTALFAALSATCIYALALSCQSSRQADDIKRVLVSWLGVCAVAVEQGRTASSTKLDDTFVCCLCLSPTVHSSGLMCEGVEGKYACA